MKIFKVIISIAIGVMLLTGCASAPIEPSLAEREASYARQVQTIFDQYDDPEMKDSALRALEPPSEKVAVEKRDFLLTRQAMIDGRLNEASSFSKGIETLIAMKNGIHTVSLSHQLLAYLTATVNHLGIKDNLAIRKIRRHVDTYCAPFNAEKIVDFTTNKINDLAQKKFNQYVAAACFSYVSGQGEKSEDYLGQAVNEAVILPGLLQELKPVKSQTGGYDHGRTALQWFLYKTQQKLDISL